MKELDEWRGGNSSLGARDKLTQFLNQGPMKEILAWGEAQNLGKPEIRDGNTAPVDRAPDSRVQSYAILAAHL